MTRQGAVEPGLHERGPRVFEDDLTSGVVLADARHAGIDDLAAVHVLDGHLAEEKVNVVIGFEGADEFRVVEPFAVVLHRPQPIGRVAHEPVDGRILAREVGGRGDEIVAVGRHQTGDVRVRTVRTLGHAVDPFVDHVDGFDLPPGAARREGVRTARQHLNAKPQIVTNLITNFIYYIISIT